MILDMREFEDFPATAHLEARPGEIEVDRDDVLEIETAKVDLSIQSSGEEYFCQGRVVGLVRLECARCLAEFTAEITGNIDFIVRAEGSPDTRNVDVIDDEEYVFLKGDDLQADVTSNIRQTLGLAVPMKPLCHADCRGLCATCGANRNETPCDCNQTRGDGRWEGLSGLASK
jgi:uncharacterized protein